MARPKGSKNRRTLERENRRALALKQEQVVASILEQAPDFTALIKRDPKDLAKEVIQAELAKLMAKIVSKGESSELTDSERTWANTVYKTLNENKTPAEKALDKIETNELLKLLNNDPKDVTPKS